MHVGLVVFHPLPDEMQGLVACSSCILQMCLPQRCSQEHQDKTHRSFFFYDNDKVTYIFPLMQQNLGFECPCRWVCSLARVEYLGHWGTCEA